MFEAEFDTVLAKQEEEAKQQAWRDQREAEWLEKTTRVGAADVNEEILEGFKGTIAMHEAH